MPLPSMVGDDILLASLAVPAPHPRSKRAAYKVSGSLVITNSNALREKSSLNKIVPTIAAASKILRTFLDEESIPDLSEEVATDCIAAQIENDGEFCIEDVDGLDGADGEYEVFVTVTIVERP